MKSFYVIIENCNKKEFEPYDVIPYFVREYNDSENKPKTFEEFKDFIIKESKYQYWSRCEYEIILCGWPNEKIRQKWDVHRQVMMNIDIITNIVINECNEQV